jgi:hypothetical protein
MKRSLLTLLIGCILIISLSDCSQRSVAGKSSLPPGQQKKLYGSKSAAPFAPGQTKKQTVSTPAKSVPPGQAKKQTGSTAAPGQAKKKTESKTSN